MLRGAASRVGPLALRLREGARYFQEGAHLKTEGGGVGKRHYTGFILENIHITKELKSASDYWITFYFVQGEPDSGTQHCGYIYETTYGSWEWADDDCTDTRSYICESNSKYIIS